MFGFRKKNRLSDLGNITNQISYERSKFKIAVIEDKVFPFLEELRRHDFNITLFEDIDRLTQLSYFPIIVSDIRGVGKKLGSKLEGAHLIEEIYNKYPNCYLIAYSSSRFDPTYNDYLKLCDENKKKSIDVSEWVQTFDKAISCSNDPIYQWEKTRKILLQKGISLDRLSKIQNAYVKAILKKDNTIVKNILSKESSGSNESMKIIYESIFVFAATLISNILKPR